METSQQLLRAAVASLPFAAVIWMATFRWKRLNFWLKMSAGTGSLAVYTLFIRGNVLARESLQATDFWLGISAAAALYGGFWLAHRLAQTVLPLPMDQLGELYALRGLAPGALIGLLVALVIAPGEELYWRGLIQVGFAQTVGTGTGLVLGVLAYGVTHLLTGRPILAVAATAAGLVWGLLLAWQGRLWPVVISHIVWDLLIFLGRPIGGETSAPRQR